MKNLAVLTLAFVLALVPVFGASTKGFDQFDELIEPEKTVLFRKFERLNVLPPSFQLEHIDELMSKDDCISMVVSIANWGENLWIKRTTSIFSRSAQKIKRFFSRINLNFSLNKGLSTRDNENLLKNSGRWNIKLKTSELDNVVIGWEILDYECEALSKMLHKASIPRTLKDEFDSIMNEVENIEIEYEKLNVVDQMSEEEMFGFDEYEKKVWGYYLLGLQHDLLPEDMVLGSSFFDRRDPQIALNVELSMYEVLLYAEKMMSYVDSLSGYATGYTQRTKMIEKNAVIVSKHISTVN